MLPGGTDPLYRAALAAAHERYLRIEVWDDSQRLDTLYDGILRPPDADPDGGLVLLDGSALSADLGSPVSRNLTLVVPLDSYLDDELLAPYGNEIRAWSGIRLGDGTTPYAWQVFAGKIQDDVDEPDLGTRSIVCADYGQDVLDHQFERPRNSDAGIPIEREFEHLVLDALPDALFGVHDLPDVPTRALVWEFDRGAALDEMLSSAGATWWVLADGRPVARRYPWSVPAAPVITLTDGEGGVILSAGRSRSRSSLYNSITATGERLNGDAAVYATAVDDNPASPTFVGGKFGIRSKTLRRQTPGTSGGAMSAAQAALRTAITPIERWTWRQVPDASVELGDIAGLDVNGRTGIVQCVTGFQLPLDSISPMTVSGRSQVVSLVAAGQQGVI